MSFGPVTSVLQSIADAAVSKYFYNVKDFVILTVITKQLGYFKPRLPISQLRGAY
jgi:hypothetical protein